MEVCRLTDLKEGEKASVVRLEMNGTIRRRMHDIGLTPNCCIECVQKSPLGDPVAYNVCGALIAIRNSDADLIFVNKG